ncbi:MAG: hypothetical protein QF660_04350 [Anaerolineales bacterium]|nr:hypothetical protein [Anaerolineales bacterium]
MRILFRPVNRQRFWRDFFVIQLGFAVFAFAIAVVIRANLGASSWAVLEVALAQIVHITPGTASVLVGAVVLLIALALREPVGWGTVVNILSIGPWEDLFLWLLPAVRDNLALQGLYLLAGLIAMSIGSAIYIGINAGAGPRDSLMMAVARASPLDVRTARVIIETAIVVAGWLLGGPLGLGTVLFALLIGPGVQAAFRLFRMETYSRQTASTSSGD